MPNLESLSLATVAWLISGTCLLHDEVGAAVVVGVVALVITVGSFFTEDL